MRKILVTAISGNVANGILKILSDTDAELYGCDIFDYPVGMDKVVKLFRSKKAVDSEYIQDILNHCLEYGITHLIPVNEKEISVISNNRELFEKAGIKVVIQSKQIIDIFLDKYATYDYLKRITGINAPKTIMKEDYIEDGKNYIVKLKNDCGSKYLKVISSKDELDEVPLKDEEFVLQEYLEDAENEYTVGVFSDGCEINVISYKRKLTNGYSSFVEYVEDDSIIEMSNIIAKEINLRGYINIQLRKQNGKNFIFEINPRISGTVVFRHMLGFKDVLWWLDLLDGKTNIKYKQRYKKAIGVRELSEKYLVLEK